MWKTRHSGRHPGRPRRVSPTRPRTIRNARKGVRGEATACETSFCPFHAYPVCRPLAPRSHGTSVPGWQVAAAPRSFFLPFRFAPPVQSPPRRPNGLPFHTGARRRITVVFTPRRRSYSPRVPFRFFFVLFLFSFYLFFFPPVFSVHLRAPFRNNMAVVVSSPVRRFNQGRRRPSRCTDAHMAHTTNARVRKQ